MTANEIKTAWNTFKKEAKKEISFDMTGCCYMNAQQIANGTATITLCNNNDYDLSIERSRSNIERVNGYDTWTVEGKKRNEECELAVIANLEQRKAKYGTKANEAKTKAAEITSSAAFKKLAKAIGIQHFEVEMVHKWETLDAYQLRIHY